MAESTAVIVETETTEVGVIISNTTVVGTVSASVEVAGGVASIVAGDNVTVDATDPANPIISAEAGGGGGAVESVVAGTNIDVDATDPANPVVSVEPLVDADIPASIARDSEVTAAVDAEAVIRAAADTALDGRLDTLEAISIATDAELAAEAALARNADNLTSGTVPDARIASTIARDSEVTAAVAAEAALARNADNLTSGTVADARIASTIARDSEVTSAISALSSVYQPLDGDLTALAGAGNSGVLAATTASFTTADETKLDGIEALADVTDAANVAAAGAAMLATGGTFAADVSVPDEAYDATAWNGSLEVPTKNAVRDKFESLGGGSVSDTAYAGSWDGDTTVAPSKNAVYDKVETLAPKTLDAVFASAATALTNTVPNSLTYQQFGTEEAVIAQADAPVSAVVIATVTANLRPGPGTITANTDRGTMKLQVSFDGGSNFADLGTATSVTLVATSTVRGVQAVCQGRATGTVTGDIQVRAMVADVDAANDTNWISGYITVIVHPQ